MQSAAGKGRVVSQIPGALVLYEDGHVERFPQPPVLPLPPFDAPSADHHHHHQFINGVATKDVSIHPVKGTWARIFLPSSVVAPLNHRKSLAPLVLHFHGGGMCIGSPADPMYHNFCSRMAVKSRSIWISVSYRLAPEHRLPAQYQDCYEAIYWVRSQFMSQGPTNNQQNVALETSQLLAKREPWEVEQDELCSVLQTVEREPWVSEHGDATRVFCSGESAGATILHFVVLQMIKREWSPLHIRGLMFVDIGVLRDPLPEMMPSTDPAVTTQMMAASVRFCLPEGAKLGDPLLDCLHPGFRHLLQEVPWPPALIFVADRDLLHNGGLEYFKALLQANKDVELHESQGYGHCFHLQKVDSEAASIRERKMVEFIHKF